MLPGLSLGVCSAAQLTEVGDFLRLRNADVAIVGDLAAPWPAIGTAALPSLLALAYRTPINDYFEMRDRLLEEIKQDDLTKKETGVLAVTMEALGKDIAKSKSNAAEARRKIEEAVKKYGLQFADPMQDGKALDKYALDSDPALKNLRDAFDKANLSTKETFGDFLVFGMSNTFEPRQFASGSDYYVVWQTEMLKAREPKSFAEARQKVVDAWYLLEARNLARQRADELSEFAKAEKGTKSPAVIISELKDKSKEDGFTLNGVARLVSQSAAESGFGKEYRAYMVETSKIKYPRSDTVDMLCKYLVDRGDSIVLSDRPERHYYVAVLQDIEDPATVQAGFQKTLKDTPLEDKLFNTFLGKEARDFQKDVIRELRIESGAALKDGDYILPEGVRERFTGRNRGEE